MEQKHLLMIASISSAAIILTVHFGPSIYNSYNEKDAFSPLFSTDEPSIKDVTFAFADGGDNVLDADDIGSSSISYQNEYVTITGQQAKIKYGNETIIITLSEFQDQVSQAQAMSQEEYTEEMENLSQILEDAGMYQLAEIAGGDSSLDSQNRQQSQPLTNAYCFGGWLSCLA